MKKSSRQNIIAISIPAVIIGGIVLAIVFSSYEADKELTSEKLKGLDFYSEQEISFLEKEGYLTASVGNKIAETKQGTTKEEVAKVLKSPTLIEQNFNSPEEHFEVLATQLDIKNNVYKMAFKLENRSSEQKNFYLIPVSYENQAQFKEIKCQKCQALSAKVPGTFGLRSLAELYDVEKHKAELRPELVQAYDDIENKGYQAQPMKVVLNPQSSYVAQSEWQLSQGPALTGLERGPVYFLVYGSAGGARDELTILNVRSHPEQGENWTVDFFTRGQADLYIVPNDQATIDDDEFVSLSCGDKEVRAQILEKDVIYYPDWSCFERGRVVHFTKKEGKHTLKFVFGNEEKYAYNNPGAGVQFTGTGSSGGWTVDSLTYTTRKMLIIDSSKIDSALTDLPVLVKLTSTNFDFSHANSDGFDIRFTQDDGTTLLEYERERHTDPNAEYWVKIPSVSATADTIFYIYYRTTDTADGAGPTNVWDVNYMGVWHLAEASGTRYDSTSNDNDLTDNNTVGQVAGKIGKAADFETTGTPNEYLSKAEPTTLDINGANQPITISAWAYRESDSGNYEGIVSKKDTNAQRQYEITIWSLDPFITISPDGGITNAVSGIGATDFTTGTARYVTGVYNDVDIRFYLNGELDANGDNPKSYTSGIYNGSAAFAIGCYFATGTATRFWDGWIDEVRVTNDARTAAEVKADYNSDNDTLLSYAPEEVYAAGALRIQGGVRFGD